MVTPPGTPAEADVCIVGGGPVGLALAHALVRKGRTVVVLESGGDHAPGAGASAGAREDDALDAEVVDHGAGLRLAPLWTSRARGVGGTGRLWNTEVGGMASAKYLPLDPLDFEARPDVPWTGWPFGAETLAPWLDGVADLCGFAPDVWRAAPPREAGDPSPFRVGVYPFGPRTAFTENLPRRLAAAPGAAILPRATATGLLWHPDGGRVAGVEWRDATGAGHRLEARATVLAAGALENARILLEAARGDPGVPWADAWWLGRGLMEHPIDRSLRLHTRDPRLCPLPGFFGPHQVGGWPSDAPGAWRLGRLSLPPERLRAEGLPNLSVRFTAQEAGAAVLEAPAARSWARRLVPGSALRRRVGDVVRWGGRQLRRRQGVEYTLHVDLEQWPDPRNRVTLGDALDAAGRRRLAVDWRWSEADEGHRLRLLDAVTRGLESAGMGRVVRDSSVPLLPDAHHHAGTTRMHADPAQGVVDPELKVHGTGGLFVCGASAFPTAGVANPTLTALALALRLAHHLASTPTA